LIYVDTSALVPYYCPEPLSPAVQRFLGQQGDRAISDLVEVELLSALARKVRTGELRRADAHRIQEVFRSHLEAGLYLRLPVERRHFAIAREWLATLHTSLATLDALHLAIAADQDCPLVTVDLALARAGRAVGARVRLLRKSTQSFSGS
jgi:predicted nucleic acid-binding protein